MVLQTAHAQEIESHPTLPDHSPIIRPNKIFFKSANQLLNIKDRLFLLVVFFPNISSPGLHFI